MDVGFREIWKISGGMSRMTVQVLASVVDKEPQTLVEEMHIETDAIIVNQCDRYGVECFANRPRSPK